ncbi:MAG: NTP transferase domain-containing protein [Ferruginibacter sp.]
MVHRGPAIKEVDEMECIILAGGLGTRLRSAVPDLPKCMAPVAGKPFLSHIIDFLQQQGVKSFIFSLGYMHEVIEHFLQMSYPALNYTRFVLKKSRWVPEVRFVWLVSKLQSQENVLVLEWRYFIQH